MPEDFENVPAEQKQGWGQFLKSLASFSGDLSSMTAPSFILSPVSLTEYPSYWGEHPDLFAACAEGADDIERMLSVLRWFIGTLKPQYMARNEKMGMEKKPLNPILGELFMGSWPDKDGRGETKLVSEQVSHHPPITAYNLNNEKAGINLEGHSAQKTSFSGRTIQVKQLGHAVLRVAKKDGGEDLYLITLPHLSIEGLWYGSPYVELSGTSYISSSTGYLATINYVGKGYFSGKAHSYKATVSPSSQPKHPLYEIEGQWSGTSKFKGKSPKGTDELFWDASTQKEELTVKAIEEQGEMESRKIWRKVADGIRTGNYDSASKEKSAIENAQRQKRKDEEASKSPHQLELFVHVDEDKEYEQLMKNFNSKSIGLPEKEDAYRRKPRVH